MFRSVAYSGFSDWGHFGLKVNPAKGFGGLS